MRTPLALATLLLAFAPAALAQPGDRGPTPLGRDGALWQTDQALAKEELLRFQTELKGLAIADWKAKALAWIELGSEPSEQGLTVPSAFRVGDLAADKAEVTGEGEEPLRRFTVAYSKKTPREITLVLTDVNATRVDCPLRDAVAEGATHLGVFVHETTVVCLAREEA